WERIPADRSTCMIHGDAWRGNCAVTSDGRSFLLDFERSSLGQPEWDSTSTAVAIDTFGALTPEDYNRFCLAYGSDVRVWAGYPTMRSIRELRLVTFALQAADQDPSALEQAQYRIACVRGLRGPRPWAWSSAG
ncbi:phosphotransferase family protein, partial [Streptomyces sp.]|uniref:phosphotransferase family protein n=1 Tax=Streptomyces sp. TaxID=1931 RepID=UPI002F41E1E2